MGVRGRRREVAVRAVSVILFMVSHSYEVRSAAFVSNVHFEFAFRFWGFEWLSFNFLIY